MRFSVTIFLLILLSTPALAQDSQPSGSRLEINGTMVRVRWSDGDSFRFLEGEYEGSSVRLGGFNALESYGPVHRWGEWQGSELAENAQQAKDFAKEGVWHCTTTGEMDHYERVLVSCPDLIEAIVGAGFGHLYWIDTPALDAHVQAQQAAQAAGVGMWAKGVPEGIVTSLHSAAEGRDSTYNRVIDTATGASTQVTHEDTYETCQEVCLSGSCLVYVPFENRYGSDRAECLR